MATKSRIFLIVLDSLGIGESPDSADFGDVGASTLKSLVDTGKLNVDTLITLGLGNIDGVSYLEKSNLPIGSFARMREASNGKDTTIGHWEIAGHISHSPLPTFPDGFPQELINAFSKAVKRDIICNKAYSGTEVIKDFGDEHLRDGSLIVYTSADSVFQIAAHESIIPPEELYEICLAARKLLSGKYSVGRVIARPFAGESPNFYRTGNRRDFSIAPPALLLPEALCNNGYNSIAIGKITDIFANQKFTKTIITHSNQEGMSALADVQKQDFNGLCFANLVDFDSKFGHRRDSVGYTEALNEFDTFLGGFIEAMRDDDILFITADHGCDPTFTKTTDHTREYTPLLIYSKNITSQNFDTRDTFADIAATIAKLLDIDFECDGTPINLNFT